MCASPQSILYQIRNQKRSDIISEDLLDQYSKEESLENILKKKGESYGLVSIRYAIPTRRVCNKNVRMNIMNTII